MELIEQSSHAQLRKSTPPDLPIFTDVIYIAQGCEVCLGIPVRTLYGEYYRYWQIIMLGLSESCMDLSELHIGLYI